MLRHTLVTAQYKVASEHLLILSMGHVVYCMTCSSGPEKMKKEYSNKDKGRTLTLTVCQNFLTTQFYLLLQR